MATSLDVFIIGAFSGNASLPSALRDAVSLSTFWCAWQKLAPEACHIMVECDEDHKIVLNGLVAKLGVNVARRIHLNVTTLLTFPSEIYSILATTATDQPKTKTRAMLVLSSHGAWNGRDSSFQIGNRSILDDRMADEIWKPIAKANLSIDVSILIDTCHSKTMMDLPYTADPTNSGLAVVQHDGPDYFSTAPNTRVISLSGCSDSELSQDSISENFGFGGGLVCSFLDYYTNTDTDKQGNRDGDESKQGELIDYSFVHYVSNRLAQGGQHVGVSGGHRQAVVDLVSGIVAGQQQQQQQQQSDRKKTYKVIARSQLHTSITSSVTTTTTSSVPFPLPALLLGVLLFLYALM